MPIWRSAATEKNQILLCGKRVPSTRRNEYRILLTDLALFSIDFHPPTPAEDVIELFTLFMIVPFD